MSRDWKPGDAALVECSDGEWRRAWCKVSRVVPGPHVWVFADGMHRDVDTSRARPLVVINPDDRGLAIRLADLVNASAIRSVDMRHGATSPSIDDVQAGLRGLLTPPRPDEPLGLGAVVEDEDGARFIRVAGKDAAWQRWKDGETAFLNCYWADVLAVRVLHEGVTP